MVRNSTTVIGGDAEGAGSRLAGEHLELTEALTRAATKHPYRPAIIDGDDAVDYHTLDNRVTAMTRTMASAGVGRGTAIAICVRRSLGAVIGIHAAIRARTVVAPVEPNDPPERLATMLREGDISHLLIDRGRLAKLPPSIRVTAVHDTTETSLVVAQITHSTPNSAAADRAWANSGGYLLFTSGSTGTPKGVLLSFDSVAHFALWAEKISELNSEDRICAQAAFTFDLSVFDIFSATYAGAAMAILPDWLKPFPIDTAAWLAEQRISVIYAVPTLLRGIAGARIPLPELRAVLYAGEPYPEPALNDLLHTFPQAAVFNLYGPTETNVCTFQRIDGRWQVGDEVSIGTAIDGVHTDIVDQDLAPCDGEGELVVAGPTVLDGYLIGGALADPTVRITFSDGVIRRAYRTGDRATRGGDGRLYLHGRADSQIKRRGYRIDLTGLAAVAGAVPEVRAAAVTYDDHEIVLIVESDESPDIAAAIAQALEQSFPSTHRPDRTVRVDAIPRNARGKIDSPRLPSIAFPNTDPAHASSTDLTA